MMMRARSPGTNANDGATVSEQPTSHAPELLSAAPLGAPAVATPGLAYADFAAALKSALRDFHCPDLLAQNPLLRQGIGNLGVSAGPRELGDIVICPEQTADVREAIVHGALHLSGMDHETDEGEMLALQAELMRWIG